MKEFKSFFKTVTASEGDRCKYPTRLDTYGCGCQHDCSYCYAKSLLDFRGLWHPDEPSVANVDKIRRKLDKVPAGTVLRLGGMTDCFQPCEEQHKVTYETIKLLNERRIEYLIVTKSDMVADYADILDPKLAHIQISITSLHPVDYEKAVSPERRIGALLKLQDQYDAALRISPLFADFSEFDKLNGLCIKKAVIEFLRVNTWIRRWFDKDYSKYTVKSGGYWHLPLNEKIRLLDQIKIPSITVCEDVPAHYEYWRQNVNPNKNDCCNLERNRI